MQVKNEISEELRLLSTVMEAISRETPYKAPAGYFIDFPGHLQQRIRAASGQNDLGSGQSVLASNPGIPGSSQDILGSGAIGYQVPEGYFEGLAGGILDRIKRSQAANDRSLSTGPLAGMPGEASEELALISPLLSGIGRKTPYQAPEGYFDTLAPILAGWQNIRAYEVPEGYFDELAGKIVARIGQQTAPAKVVAAPAKVVTMGSRNRGWWRYSAAAVVAGLALTIGWLRLHTASAPSGPVVAKTVNIADGLVKLSDQDIQNYLDTDNLPLAEAVTNSTATLDIDDNDVKSLLGDVPDGELKQYMEEHGGAKDMATN
jgi:hypothetical protein